MDRLIKLFEEQKNLHARFHEIEARNGVARHSDRMTAIPIDDPYSQHRIRTIAWYIAEECAELEMAIDSEVDRQEIEKEFSDILHFLIEFSILSGFHPSWFVEEDNFTGEKDSLDSLFELAWKPESETHFNRYVGYFLLQIGKTTHLLKNKPWKQTLRETNIMEYKLALKRCWTMYAGLARGLGITAKRLVEIYYVKNQENHQRINGNV